MADDYDEYEEDHEQIEQAAVPIDSNDGVGTPEQEEGDEKQQTI